MNTTIICGSPLSTTDTARVICQPAHGECRASFSASAHTHGSAKVGLGL